jgi:type III pantothenate kinase
MKYNLALDIGNTWIKGAYFNDQFDLIHQFKTKNLNSKFYKEINNSNFPIVRAIVSNVRKIDSSELRINAEKEVLHMNPNLTYPFSSSYTSPNTLGMDRVCAVAGALEDFPKKDLLIVTAGTCITYNFITKSKVFLGGAISPGLSMRYKALSKFTGKLPLVIHHPFESIIGLDTEECIRSGVQFGLIHEVDGAIQQYKDMYPELEVIMTGGATVFFENRLKNKIFADQSLIFKGLNSILKLNAK